MKKAGILLFIFYLFLFSAEKWNYTFGFDTGDEIAKSVILTSDSCYVFTGQGYDGALTIKVDSDGKLIWQDTHFAWLASGEEVIEVADKYIVSGWRWGLHESNVLISNYGKNIDTVWTYYYPSEERVFYDSYAIVKTSDGGYVVPVNSSFFSPDLLKLNENCEFQWFNTPTTGVFDNGAESRSILQINDLGFIVVGFEYETYSLPDSSDVFIYKSDSLGNFEWAKTFGDSLKDDRAYKVISTDDNGFLISGYTESYGVGGKDAWLIKTDSLGNEIWNKTYGGSFDDYCYSIDKTMDGNYILAGSTSSFGDGMQDVWLIKIDQDGNELWSETYGDSLDDVGYSVKSTLDGGYIIAGYTESYGSGGKDVWLIKTDENGVTSIENEQSTINDYDLLKNYPNPFNPNTTIEYNLQNAGIVNLKIYDVQGREVATFVNRKEKRGSHKINFNGSNLTSGIYFYSLFVDGKVLQSRKMMLLK